MLKKIGVCLLAIVLFSASLFSVAKAEYEDLMDNGEFETLKVDGTPAYWTFTKGSFGDDFFISTNCRNAGKNALLIQTEKDSVTAACTIRDFVPGTTYEVSIFSNIVSHVNGFSIKLEFFNVDESGEQTRLSEHDFQNRYTSPALGTWQEQKFQFTAPGNGATVLLRFYGGEAYFDDFAIKGQRATPFDFKDPVDGSVNLIDNGEFEEPMQKYSKKWIPYESVKWEENTYVTIDSTGGRNGSSCIKIASDGEKSPWVCAIMDVVPRAEYQITAYLKKPLNLTGQGAGIKFEYYSSAAGKLDLETRAWFTDVKGNNKWTHVAADFTPPEGCDKVYAHFRLSGAGEIYWDDVSCYMVKEPSHVLFETDNIIYYSDWTEGTATVSPNPDITLPDNCTVYFTLSDGAGTVKEDAVIPLSSNTKFVFPVSALEKIGTPYTVQYVCRRADGTEIEQGCETIYRYDRPKALNTEGIYIKDGKPFFPVIGYHVGEESDPQVYAYCKEAGINVVQYLPGGTNDPERITAHLNRLQGYGLMAFVGLYETTTVNNKQEKELVELVKDHPATFGYMLMDEPTLQGTDFAYLEGLYRMVRETDAKHPVYMVEGQAAALNYPVVGKCVDILAVDPYPFDAEKTQTLVAEHVELAREAVNHKKPVYCINMIMTQRWSPSPDDIRNMHYQALLAGAYGLGYYDVKDSYGYNNGAYEHMWQRDSYEGVVSFAEKEVTHAFSAFVLQQYPVYAQRKTDTAWWKCYEDDGELYCVVINRTQSPQACTIPLADVASGSRIQVINGIDAKNIEVQDGSVQVTLRKGAAAVFKVTPQSIHNGGFENCREGKPLSWSVGGETAEASGITVVSSVPGAEGNCVKIESAETVSQSVQWIAGKMYAISFRFMSPDSTVPKVLAENSTLPLYTLDTPENLDWQTYTIYPVALQTGTVTLHFYGTEGSTVYYDAVEMWEMPETSGLRFYTGNAYVNSVESGNITGLYQHRGQERAGHISLILALYEIQDGKKELLRMEVVRKEVAEQQPGFEIQTSLTVKEAETDCCLYAFIWSDSDGLTPINRRWILHPVVQ